MRCKVKDLRFFKRKFFFCFLQRALNFFRNRFSVSHPLSRKNLNAFTLAELLVVTVILGVAIVGMVNLFIYTSVAATLAGNKTLAVAAAQSKMEEIRNHDYSLIATDYASGGTPGDTFFLSQVNGTGVIYIDSSNAQLLEIKVVVSWEDKYDRIIGEDIDLDGILDTGEDSNLNGELDSIVNLVMLFAQK
ncbi:MAG: type II secretion system protein [Candidatus Aceula lacicola]|nr:type II secretion system protein [Candidatus Aceula lacicola]